MINHHKKLALRFGTLVMAMLLCVGIVGVRIVSAGRTGYLFLVWNLFLAFLPLLFAGAAELFHRKKSHIRFWIFSVLWLLFFPNAPYIVTDFVHLFGRGARVSLVIPWWFDFIMLTAFAVTGILLGLCSLQIMQRLVTGMFGKLRSWFFMVTVSLLTGFGIYLGRFLRWNSWDVLLNPLELLRDIGTRIVHPLAHAETWFISFLFGALVLSSFLIFDSCCRYVVPANADSPKSPKKV